MRVYATGFRAFNVPVTHVYVTPGASREADPADWWMGEQPVMFDVEFKFGVAEVADELGKYMLDKKIAGKSKIIPQAA